MGRVVRAAARHSGGRIPGVSVRKSSPKKFFKSRASCALQTTPVQPASRGHQEALSRRTLLKAAATSAGGLVITVALPSWPVAARDGGTKLDLNAFVRIEPDGRVHLTIPSVEMGQGVYTSMSMLLAEELEVGLDAVTVEHAPPNDALYANPLPILRQQTTGASASMRGFWLPLRRAGASARMMIPSAIMVQLMTL